MNGSVIFVIILILLLIGAGYFYLRNREGW